MAFQTSFPNMTLALTPSEDQGSVLLDFHQLLFNYLRLLRFDTKGMSAKHHIKFDKDLFKVPNQKAFHYVVHFLFTKLDPGKTAETFRDAWPIVDRKQEAEFRKKVKNWLVEIHEENKDTFQFGHINPAMFLSPGGEKFAHLLCALAAHILTKMAKKSPTLAPPSTNPSKNPLMTQFKLQMLRGNLLADLEGWSKTTTQFRHDYQDYKQLSGRLLGMYRELCQREQRAKAELLSMLEQNSSLSDSQKQSLLDVNDNSVCIELAKDIDSKQDHINNLMKKLLSFEKTFTESWDIVHQVVNLNESRPVLRASRIVQELPPNFIESYQNAHSGSQLEFKKRNGQYDFVSLLNLLLFSLTTGVELSNSLNIPPLENENKKLAELEESIQQQSIVADQLFARWRKIEDEHTANMDRLVRSKRGIPVPVTLRPFTPFRNVFNGDSDFAETATPPMFRTALGMTPCLAAAAAAKPKLLNVKKSRASIDELAFRLPTREEYRWSIGENSATPCRSSASENSEIRAGGKRESGNAGLELSRKTSIEADASKRSSIHRTPPVSALPPSVHTRLSRTGSLAASPALERVKHQAEKAPANGPPKHSKQRRSIHKVVHEHVHISAVTTSINLTPRNSRMDAVMERAAENIVYDLISIDSPGGAAGATLIDPNSSFEKNAFASRNLIQRSPEPGSFWYAEAAAAAAEKQTSNVELLKMLETIVSPRGRSSLAKRVSGIGINDSESRAESPASIGWLDGSSAAGAFFDLNKEKGLLEASSASLIDEVLDFSLGWQDSFHAGSITLASEPGE